MASVNRAMGLWVGVAWVVVGCGGSAAVPVADGGWDADPRMDAAESGVDAAVVRRDGSRFACDPVLTVADPGTDGPADGISYIKASNTQPSEALGNGANFGQAVAISADGNTLAVGASRECVDSQGINGDQSCCIRSQIGAVYVFRRTGSTRRWVQEAYIKHPETRSSGFGTSVALSVDGSTVAVGSSGTAVLVFRRGDSGWREAGRLSPSNFDAYDQFGSHLAVSENGTVVAVSAAYEDGAATGVDGDGTTNWRTDSGAVYVFRQSDSGWMQEAYIKASNPSAYDWFGEAIALSGDGRRLIVGAWGEDSSDTTGSDENIENAGAVYVFQRGDSWSQTFFLKATNVRETSRFGSAVALSYDGATLAMGGGDRVFVRRLASGSWTEIADLRPTGVPDFFARSLAMNPDGSLIVAGFPFDDSGARGVGVAMTDTSAMDSGAAATFALRSGGWVPLQYLKATNTDAGDHFGEAVAVGNRAIAVGAYDEASGARGVGGNQADNSAPGAGAVYVY